MEKVFRTLKRHYFDCKPVKHKFRKSKYVYPGHLIGQGTLSIPEDKMADSVEYAWLVTVKELRSFLGTVDFTGREFLHLQR